MARTALKGLSRREPTYVELTALFEAIKKQKNDQAVAILCAALVEDALQDAIRARMVTLTDMCPRPHAGSRQVIELRALLETMTCSIAAAL